MYLNIQRTVITYYNDIQEWSWMINPNAPEKRNKKVHHNAFIRLDVYIVNLYLIITFALMALMLSALHCNWSLGMDK